MLRAIDALDGLGKLVTARGRRNDLVAGRGAYSRYRNIVGGLGKRHDEFGPFEIDADREVPTRDFGRNGCGGVGVQRAVGEVDEPQRQRLGDGRGQVLLADEVAEAEYRRQWVSGPAGFGDRDLQVVARQHVAIDQKLAQNPLLTSQHLTPSVSSPVYRQRWPRP